MRIYQISNNVIIENKLLPFKGYIAMNLFGIIFTRDVSLLNGSVLSHEEIHTKQLLECFIIFFYPLYLLEWFIKLFFYGKNSYHNISFERDARNYLNRKSYDWIKRIWH